MLSFRVLVLEHHIEHLGEVLTEMMGSSALDTTATDGDVKLDCGGVDGSGESLVLRLATTNNRAS